MPVSNSDAGELADIANSDLVDRLDALERRLDADRQRQKSTLAALQDQMASPSSPPPENSQNNDLGSGAKADIAAIRNDMDQRFAALKAILANQALPVKAGGRRRR
jgi:hypothetical protein